MPIDSIIGAMAPYLVSSANMRLFFADRCADLLVELGRHEYEAAVEVLQNAKQSDDPRREVTTASALLILASKRFATVRSSQFYRFVGALKSAITLGIASPGVLKAAEGAVECTLLLCGCYSYLNQEESFRKYIARAPEDFEIYATASVEQAYHGGGLAGSASVMSIAAENRKERVNTERERF